MRVHQPDKYNIYNSVLNQCVSHIRIRYVDINSLCPCIHPQAKPLTRAQGCAHAQARARGLVTKPPPQPPPGTRSHACAQTPRLRVFRSAVLRQMSTHLPPPIRNPCDSMQTPNLRCQKIRRSFVRVRACARLCVCGSPVLTGAFGKERAPKPKTD